MNFFQIKYSRDIRKEIEDTFKSNISDLDSIKLVTIKYSDTLSKKYSLDIKSKKFYREYSFWEKLLKIFTFDKWGGGNTKKIQESYDGACKVKDNKNEFDKITDADIKNAITSYQRNSLLTFMPKEIEIIKSICEFYCIDFKAVIGYMQGSTNPHKILDNFIHLKQNGFSDNNLLSAFLDVLKIFKQSNNVNEISNDQIPDNKNEQNTMKPSNIQDNVSDDGEMLMEALDLYKLIQDNSLEFDDKKSKLNNSEKLILEAFIILFNLNCNDFSGIQKIFIKMKESNIFTPENIMGLNYFKQYVVMCELLIELNDNNKLNSENRMRLICSSNIFLVAMAIMNNQPVHENHMAVKLRDNLQSEKFEEKLLSLMRTRPFGDGNSNSNMDKKTGLHKHVMEALNYSDAILPETNEKQQKVT